MAKRTDAKGQVVSTKKPVATKPAATPRKSSSSEAVKRIVATLNIKPEKLKLDPKFYGRTTLIGEDEQIVLADSIRQTGQEQPCQVRDNGDGTYTVVFGNSRKLAADHIVNGYKWGDRKIEGNPEFTLRCEVVDCDDNEAFISNVVENAHRNQCSPIDNARNQQTLRDAPHEMSDNAIARLYGYNGSAYVNRLKKLLTLPDFIQESIHGKNCSAGAGFILADCKDIAEEDAYEAVWKLVKSDGDEDETPIGKTEMATAIREWRTAKKEAAKAKDGKGDEGEGEGDEGEGDDKNYILSRSAFRKQVEEIGGDEQCPEKTGQMMVAILDFIDGKCSQKVFTNRTMKLFEEKSLPKPEKTKEEKPAKAAK